jgi:transposase
VKQTASKTCYRIRNWPEYNRALIARGSLRLWIPPNLEQIWNAQPVVGRGRPSIYSDAAIIIVALLGLRHRLPLRAAQGFVTSLFELSGVALLVPHFSTVARRIERIVVDLARFSDGRSIDVVVDSTGIKVFGEGEWKVRQHGVGKRRTWRKLHLAVDARTQEIVAVETSTNAVHDCEVFEDLIARVDAPISSIAADGAYDVKWCYRIIEECGARALIDPRKNAKPWPLAIAGADLRNENLRRIEQIGLRLWKQESGYHRRSLAETAMFRVKAIFGERVASRRFERQRVELLLRTRALNIMTSLGMPDSYPVIAPQVA